MTRKEFQLIAQAISSIEDDDTRAVAAQALAKFLPCANLRFDPDVFLRACHVDPIESAR